MHALYMVTSLENGIIRPLTPNVREIWETQRVRKKVCKLGSFLSTLLFFHFYCCYCSLVMGHDYSVQLAVTSFSGKQKTYGGIKRPKKIIWQEQRYERKHWCRIPKTESLAKPGLRRDANFALVRLCMCPTSSKEANRRGVAYSNTL